MKTLVYLAVMIAGIVVGTYLSGVFTIVQYMVAQS